MSGLSKPITQADNSGEEFTIEMLAGDKTYGINFDRVQWDVSLDGYVIVELLLCDEKQFPRGITPYSSHPNRYFNQNSRKFISLWELASKLRAKLYLVNYSKKGTQYENEVLLMEVKSINSKENPPVNTTDKRMTRSEFSQWFRELNKRGDNST